jgi:hypothetical protein
MMIRVSWMSLETFLQLETHNEIKVMGSTIQVLKQIKWKVKVFIKPEVLVYFRINHRGRFSLLERHTQITLALKKQIFKQFEKIKQSIWPDDKTKYLLLVKMIDNLLQHYLKNKYPPSSIKLIGLKQLNLNALRS